MGQSLRQVLHPLREPDQGLEVSVAREHESLVALSPSWVHLLSFAFLEALNYPLSGRHSKVSPQAVVLACSSEAGAAQAYSAGNY